MKEPALIDTLWSVAELIWLTKLAHALRAAVSESDALTSQPQGNVALSAGVIVSHALP